MASAVLGNAKSLLPCVDPFLIVKEMVRYHVDVVDTLMTASVNCDSVMVFRFIVQLEDQRQALKTRNKMEKLS